MEFWGNFSKVVRGCFEPLFVAMAVAVLVWLWAGVKKKDWRPCVAPAAVVLFMVAWRCFIPHFYSHRYAAAVAFPAILFSAWLLGSLRGGFAASVIDKAAAKCRFLTRRCVLTVAAVAIIGGGVAASLNVDYDMRFLANAAKAVVNDAQGRANPLLLSYTKETWLLEMLCERPVTHGKIKIDNDPPSVAMLRQTLRENSRQWPVIYVFCTQMPGQGINAADLALPGKWERVFAGPMGHKRKRYFHVYRYENAAPPPPVLIAGGASAAAAIERGPHGETPQRPAPGGDQSGRRVFRPRAGHFALRRGNPAAQGEMAKGLQGEYPLRIKARYVKRNESPPFAIVRRGFPAAVPLRLEFRVKGQPGTDVLVSAYYFSPKDKTVRAFIPVLPLRLAADGAPVDCRCEFLPGFFPAPDGAFQVVFSVARGEAFFGDVRCVLGEPQKP